MLVEHYVARESQTSLIGNVYLGRVQNVLPSMEAAFIDIGKGRNAVLYAGEVNWSALGHKERPAAQDRVGALLGPDRPGAGHQGPDRPQGRPADQPGQPGRAASWSTCPTAPPAASPASCPTPSATGSRRCSRRSSPSTAGVIVRTAAEGASEDELTRDVERLTARWDDIEKKVDKGNAPQLLYGEPDLTLKVVRDLFTEDFAKLVIEGDDAWDIVAGLRRARRARPRGAARALRAARTDQDVFAAYRIDEQIAKGLDRKVWLPSGGSLVIDRTEAMTVVDVNTGKFTGSGRQPRGDRHQEQPRGGRGDRPPAPAARHRRHHRRRLHRHGARVQPRPGAAPPGRVPGPRPHPPPGRRGDLARPGADDPQADRHRPAGVVLHDCEHCQGRGVVIEDEPVEPKQPEEEPRAAAAAAAAASPGHRRRAAAAKAPSPKDIAAMARHHEERTPRTQAEDRRRRSRREEPPRIWPRMLAEDQADDQVAGRGRAVRRRRPRRPEPVEVEPSRPSPSRPSRSQPRGRHPHPAPVGEPSGRAAARSEPGRRTADGDAASNRPTRRPALHVPVKRKGARKR